MRFDPTSGEKHVADVMTPSGLVIEFQNSRLPQQELVAREGFYDSMVWIVNAQSFRDGFAVLGKLPHPKSDLAREFIFVPPGPGRLAADAMFWRKSENPERLDENLVEIRSVREITHQIDEAYKGHHMFHWKHPRQVWFAATRPVFLHPGGEILLRLMPYNERDWCVQLFRRDQVVARILDKHGHSGSSAV